MTIMASEMRDCSERTDSRLHPAAAGLRRAREVGDQEGREQRSEARSQRSEVRVHRSEQPSGPLALVLVLVLVIEIEIPLANAQRSTPNAQRPTEEHSRR